MRITHIITGLTTGGAEMMLYRLLRPLADLGVFPEVVCLTEPGPIAQKIRATGVSVQHIPARNLPKLVSKLRRDPPDLVQTWMYHADLVGAIAARLAGIKTVVWDIQNGTIDPRRTKWSTRMVVKLCSISGARLATKIVACGDSVAKIHTSAGFPEDRMIVIYNGFDTKEFLTDREAGFRWRKKHGITASEFVIAQFARYDPQKDYENLVAATRYMKSNAREPFRLVLCGSGVDVSNNILVDQIERAGIRDRVILLGLQDDVRPVMAAADIATLSSRYGEGTPVSIGESMAMTLPCVVTDVGDSAYLVGECGLVVPPGQPAALADGWQKLQQMPVAVRNNLGNRARERVSEKFELKMTAKQYFELYGTLVTTRSSDVTANKRITGL